MEYFILGMISTALAKYTYTSYYKQYPIYNQILQQQVELLSKTFPDLKRHTIVSSTKETMCVDKSIIYINTIGCTSNEIIDRILHEYAHVLNKDSWGHDDNFYKVLDKLYVDLKKQKYN